MKMNTPRAVAAWLLTGCFLVFLMVMIGGTTRLTHSGLSMVRWNVAGSLPPVSAEKWETLFSQYKQSPEFRLVNAHYTLDDFKRIFWWEFIHRFLGRAIGWVFILPFGWFLWKRMIDRRLLKKLLVLFALGALQGVFGWLMVKSGLDQAPHVSHYFLALHLGTAFVTFGYTLWLALDLLYPREKLPAGFPVKQARLQLALVFVQVVWGAFVAGLQAGMLFPQFPRMGEGWIPPDVFSLQPVWKNFVENGAGVQLVHRVLGGLVVANTAVLLFRGVYRAPASSPKKWFYALGAAAALQFTLGVLTLLLHVPVALALLHQAGAFLLFACTLLLLHRGYGSKNSDAVRERSDAGGKGEKDKARPDDVQAPDPVGKRDRVREPERCDQPY